MNEHENRAKALEVILDKFPSTLKHPLTITFSLKGGMIDPSENAGTSFSFVYDPATKTLTGTGVDADGPISGKDEAKGPLKSARMVFDFMWDFTQLALEGIAGPMFAPPMIAGFAVSRVRMMDEEYGSTVGQDHLSKPKDDPSLN